MLVVATCTLGTSSMESMAENLKPYLEKILESDSGQITFDKNGYAYELIYQKTASDWYIIYVVNKKIINEETIGYRNNFIVIYIICFIISNISIILYYIKHLKSIKLKERAEMAEGDLIEYKDNLEKVIIKNTDDIRKQRDKLKQLNISIIDNIADIVEFRDTESGRHIKRIKKFTFCLAFKAAELYPEYKLSKEKIDLMHQAAPLHDVGKIGIPDSILLKPSKLTKEEYEEMKKHTTIGYELINRILENYDAKLLYYARKISKYHHERYDGKGYPEGLIGEEIPVCAQIVGIADVYDALTEKRVYKEAFSHEKSIEMIKNGECGVFSDKLIFCLEIVKDEFYRISKEN